MAVNYGKSIFKGAAILTVAGVITRIFGFVYRIFMSNIMGAEGMGLYQLIMPIYMLAWSISCSGFNTAVSKLIAQERVKGEYGNMGRVLKQAVMITTGIGLLLTAVLYFGADLIAVYIIRDARAAMPLRILSLAFPFMAAGTCVRGYFIGLQETTVPAVNQVLEQFVRMAIVYALAGSFIHRGLEFACAVAVIGIVAEEIFSFFYISFAYKRHRKKTQHNKKPAVYTSKVVWGMLLAMAVPLTANRVTGSLLSAWENVLIPGRLQLAGMSAQEAMSTFGRLTGMAMPLIYFPTAMLTALSVTLVPAVSEAVTTKNYSSIASTASKSVLFASICGMGAAALFIAFPNELGQVIYNQQIGYMLMMMGVLCPLLYIQIVFAGILNGLGCQVFIFRNSLISSLISIGFIFFLVPQFGIVAYIAGTFFSLLVVCTLELAKIRETIQLEVSVLNWIAKPILAATMAGVAARVAADQLFFPLPAPIGLTLGIIVLMCMYGLVIILTGCLSKSDLQTFFRFLPTPKSSQVLPLNRAVSK